MSYHFYNGKKFQFLNNTNISLAQYTALAVRIQI